MDTDFSTQHTYRMVLVGAGLVSCELGPAWKAAGHDILHVISRTASSAQPLAQRLGCPWSTGWTEAAGALADAEVVVVAVTDGLIEELAEGMSTMLSPSCVMVHLSGATPLEVLRSPGAVVWPVRSFNPKAGSVPLNGTPTVVEGTDRRALGVAQRLAEAWDAELVEARGEQRAAAHLAAVMADNYANHMLAEAQEVLSQRGLPKTLIRNLVLGLTQGGLHGDARERQTGPAKRGDEATLERHRTLLPDDMKALYDVLAAHIAQRHHP
ncbi:MAG: hypothetical protein RLZZ314_1850 [Bacteroidota bacterium]|nr:DUF2520 domain-containing protein [Bacteroidota bacterium]